MKKIIIVTLFIFSLSNLNAQKNLTWFFISLKGGYGTSMLYNKASFDDQNIIYSFYSPSYYYGSRFGFLFGDHLGVSAEISMNNFSQNYNIETQNSSFKQLAQLSSFDYAIYLNLKASTGIYFNIGPNFSNLKSADLTTTDNNSKSKKSIISKLSPNFNSLVVELGLTPIMTDLFEMRIGIRGNYSFDNIISEPTYIIPIDNRIRYSPNYTDEKTNPIQLMASVEFIYVFGRYGRASCGKYRFMINN
jgi:hypothetical protein